MVNEGKKSRPSQKSVESFLDVAMGLYGKKAKDDWNSRKKERDIDVSTPLAVIRADEIAAQNDVPATDEPVADKPNIEDVVADILQAPHRKLDFMEDRLGEEMPPIDPYDKLTTPWLNSPQFLEENYLNLLTNNEILDSNLKQKFTNANTNDDWRHEEERRQAQVDLDAMLAKREEEARQRQIEIDAVLARQEEERRIRRAEIDEMVARRKEEKKLLYNNIRKVDVNNDNLKRDLAKAFNDSAYGLPANVRDLDHEKISGLMKRSRQRRGHARQMGE